MKKRVIKLIVCIMLISALMIGFCSAYASAATPVWLLRAKAGIAAAMLATNLIINPINAALDDSLLEGIDPIGYVSTIQDTPWTDYIDLSTIVVRPDVVTIDGVQYSDIWLGPDAANSLRLTGLDFASAYNILTNQSQAITYAEGAGYFHDLPMYEVDGRYMTQHITVPVLVDNEWHDYSISGDVYLSSRTNTAGTSNIGNIGVSSPNHTVGRNYHRTYTDDFGLVTGYCDKNSTTVYFQNTSDGEYVSNYINSGQFTYAFTADEFSFDYTSGDIYVQPDPEDGLLMRVPSSYDDGNPGSVFNYDIHDIVVNYPQVNDTNGHELIFDPNLNPDFDVDLDMGNALGDIITAVILAKLADLLGDDTDVIYAPMPEKDEPLEPGIIDPLPDPDPAPDIPEPGSTIAETDWTLLDDLLRWIQSTIDSIRHITEALQTMLDNIIEGINDILESIRELADKILEDIELGPAKLFDKALDILKTLFLPLLLPIRAMMNLWHYVVEWIQSVSGPFTWIFGIMSSTSGNMVLPIYALLAGGICISIYKALGR